MITAIVLGLLTVWILATFAIVVTASMMSSRLSRGEEDAFLVEEPLGSKVEPRNRIPTQPRPTSIN